MGSVPNSANQSQGKQVINIHMNVCVCVSMCVSDLNIVIWQSITFLLIKELQHKSQVQNV